MMFGNANPAPRPIVLAVLAGGLAGLSLLALDPGAAPDIRSNAMQATSAERPATVVTPVSCEKLADIPGKAIATATVSFPPGAYSPAHRHPGSVTAYVLKGAVRSQLSGGPAITYGTGDTWFEPTGILHLFAENESTTEPAEILAVFVTDENCGPLVIPVP